MRARVTYGRRDNGPRFVPPKSFDIYQNTLQLNHCKRRVGIIELDSNLIGKLPPSALGLLESANDVV